MRVDGVSLLVASCSNIRLETTNRMHLRIFSLRMTTQIEGIGRLC